MSKHPSRGSFSPGLGQHGVSDPPIFDDAADHLLTTPTKFPFTGSKGVLLLADGTRAEGRLFGSCGIGMGELVLSLIHI